MKSIVLILFFVIILISHIHSQAPTTINDFFLPGSQPLESGNLESPNKCDNCHGGYDINVEMAYSWRGSMMSQAMRDPLFLAAMAIANQDAPASGDLCIRCHTPQGWLGGRSTPTDGSALLPEDYESVMCDFCHKLIKPSPLGVNPYPNDSIYTADTYANDQVYLATITAIPSHPANGMAVVDNGNAKRGPYSDANPKHQHLYSPFHNTSEICGTCHDVSNPVFSKDPSGKYLPNSFDAPAPDFSPYELFPIERTYSEWLMSEYNQSGVYAPQFGGNLDTVSTCQDCHMRAVTGYGANKSGILLRDDLALHDMTGGNTFVPYIIDSLYSASGVVDGAALMAGVARARIMLQNAASMMLTPAVSGTRHLLTVRIINETGHKLPSGYPEGRRIWINIQAYDGSDNLIYESGAYDSATAVLTQDADLKNYHIEPGISNTLAPVVGYPAGPSFHFVLNDTIYMDNRIPPRGFTNAAFETIQSPPIGYTYSDGQYWDETDYLIPGGAAKIKVRLFYQTTSKEFVEFMRDENVTDTTGQFFYDLWTAFGKSSPELMLSDSVFVTPMIGNSIPVLDPIGDKTTDENQLLNFSITASDADGTISILTTSALPSGASFNDNGNNSGTFNWLPDLTQAGSYPIIFYATDDSAAVDSEIVTITVNNINQIPILNPIGNRIIDENLPLNFNVSAADGDGVVPTLTTSALPSTATFTDHNDGTGSFDWTPDFDQSGTYPVTFYATDEYLAVDSELITITVANSNRPPVLDTISDTILTVLEPLAFTISGYDLDLQPVTFSYASNPNGASLIDNGDGTADFSWTPIGTQAGLYNILFIISDGILADSQYVLITVLADTCCVDPRGNVDGDPFNILDIDDIVYLVEFGFSFPAGPPPPCLDEADANGDGFIDIDDVVWFVEYAFGFPSGPPPVDCP